MDAIDQRQAAKKPAKPYPDFPLTPHPSGKWAKKVKGKLYYFGRWSDPAGALDEWKARKNDILRGRRPTVPGDGSIVVRDLANAFLDRQRVRQDEGLLEARSFVDTRMALKVFAAAVGPTTRACDLQPADFLKAREAYANVGSRGPYTVNRYLTNVKSAFNWTYRNGLLAAAPKYGDGFAKASVKEMRRAARATQASIGKATYTAADVKLILANARPPLTAMILLGLNAGFYNIDAAGIPLAALDLDAAWLEFPRHKTEEYRATPLWPETVDAIRKALPLRGKPTNPADKGLAFIHPNGRPWVYKATRYEDGTIDIASRTDWINKEFTDVLTTAGIRRSGVNFAALRDTFATLADEVRDANAVHIIRGHALPGMDAHYVKGVDRKRLIRVTEHVRRKLKISDAYVVHSRSSTKRGNRNGWK